MVAAIGRLRAFGSAGSCACGGKGSSRQPGAPNECPICFEIYSDDGDGSHVPRMLPCGHTGCHGCFALMLRPAQPSKDRSGKPLECPVCRVETHVKDGQASSLPKNFVALG